MARSVLVLLAVGFVVATACLVVGSILISKSTKKLECRETRSQKGSPDFCSYSDEAGRIGLGQFLSKVQAAFYDLHPEMLPFKTGISSREMKQNYKPYDPSPSTIKLRTDVARGLLNELQGMSVENHKLKPREKKAFSQVEFFLRHVFAVAYDGNYYTGDWLIGPDLLCYKPICLTTYTFHESVRYFQPSNVADMESLKRMLFQTGQTFSQYESNLKYGVMAGMVGSKETCEAGKDSMKSLFPKVMLKGENGIFDEHYTQSLLSSDFLADLRKNQEDLKLWEENAGKTANESIREFVLEYLGKPISKLTRYVESEYIKHCVSSNISSGLASLPLPYVYVNDTPDVNQLTTRKLPNGDPLNGTHMYQTMMPYFTTNDMTPDEVHQLGFEMLHKLYPEALRIAREVTSQDDNETAKQEFKALLNNASMYFNKGDIPNNESDTNAFNLCQSVDAAKKYCPVRWEAINNWFYEARQVMSLLESKISQFFFFTGEKNTVPNCPVTMVPDFNPSSGAQSYMRSDSSCSVPAHYNIPFFLERPGPLYEEWSVNAHEARPGHHIQDQGTAEHFLDQCGGVIGWLDSESQDSYTAFSEGWALYAEYPLIARETNLYANEPLQKYGMLKWQIWRALRLIVDTGLHYKGWSRDEALNMFAEFAWDRGDTARKEVTRYQSDPAQATAYMVGQLHIIKLREYAEKELGSNFNLKDFHYQLLSQGTAPLSHLENHIKKFVSCVKDNEEPGCEYLLQNTAPPVTKRRTMQHPAVAKPRRVYYL